MFPELVLPVKKKSVESECVIWARDGSREKR